MKIPDHLPAPLKPLPPLPFWRLAYNVFRRQVGCRLGFHDTRLCPDGTPPNFCGTQLNPRAYIPYAVTLKDGTRHVVQAINAQHARNLVIYGEASPSQISPIALARQIIKVHPANIADVVRIEA